MNTADTGSTGSGTDHSRRRPADPGPAGFRPSPSLFIPVGFISLVCQVVFLRETLSIFESSEYFLSLFWFVWLGANSLGLLRRPDPRTAEKSLVSALFGYAFSITAGFFLLRSCHVLLSHGLTPTGFFGSLAVAAAVLASVSFLNGRIFRLFNYFGEIPVHGLATIKLYYNETLGFIIAGLVLLAGFHRIPDVLLLLSSVGLLAIPALSDRSGSNPVRVAVFLALLLGICLASGLLNRTIISAAYPGYNLKKEVTTPYGRLDVLTYGGEEYAIYSGKPLALEHEPGMDEELLYPCLSQFQRPVSVLVNGISLLNFLPSMKTPAVRDITVCLQDKVLADYLAGRLSADGEFNRKTRWIPTPVQSIESGDYDIIFLDLAKASKLEDTVLLDPMTLRKIKKALKKNGILQISTSAEGAYLSEFGALLIGNINNSLKTAFKHTSVLLLENRSLVLASDIEPDLDIGRMVKALKKSGVEPVYFNEFNTGSRIESASNIGLTRILDVKTANSLSSPEIYLNGLVMNLTEYGLGIGLAFGRGLLFLERHTVFSMALLVLLLALGIFLFWLRDARYAVTLTAGGTHLGLQISIFYLFQMRFGGLYQNLGLLTAVMMIGLALGLSFARTNLRLRPGLILSCAVAGGLAACLLAEPESRLIFFLLSLAVGFDQGLLFGLMNREPGKTGTGTTGPGTTGPGITGPGITGPGIAGAGNAGAPEMGTVLIYAAEMAGAGFASLVIPLLIIPVFGFPALFILALGLTLAANALYLALKKRA